MPYAFAHLGRPPEIAALQPAIKMNHRTLLHALLNLTEPLKTLGTRLRKAEVDEYEDPVVLNEDQIAHVLHVYQSGKMSARDVEVWANLVEDRDDIVCSSTSARDVMHELANPFLTEDLTFSRARELCECLKIKVMG